MNEEETTIERIERRGKAEKSMTEQQRKNQVFFLGE